MEVLNALMPLIVGLFTILIPAYWLHRREIEKQKSQKKTLQLATGLLDSMLDLRMMYIIRQNAEMIFEETQADRFLLLIAFNGKHDFQFVSVICEEHEDKEKYKAIERYGHLSADQEYRELLKQIEAFGSKTVNVSKMKESMLKDLYDMEGVMHSHLRFLMRKKINRDNDVIIYSSIATHKDIPFTRSGLTKIRVAYDSSIVPNLKKFLRL